MVPAGEPTQQTVDALAARVQEDRRRLRERLEAVQRQAVALTPSHQLRTSPIAWALGAATIGLLLGVITAPRR